MALMKRGLIHFARIGSRHCSNQVQEKKPIVHATATGVPDNVVYQNDYANALAENCDDPKESQKVLNLFARTMINKRHMIHYDLKNDSLPMLDDKMNASRTFGIPLAVSTAREALKQANVNPEDVGMIVCASSIVGLPGIGYPIGDQLGLPGNAIRAHETFLGCGGGLQGLDRANNFCIVNPGKAVVFLTVDIASPYMMQPWKGKETTKELVKRSLFADGCSATVMSGETLANHAGKWALEGSATMTLNNSTAAATYLTPRGYTANLTPEVQLAVGKTSVPLFAEVKAKFGFENADDIDLWACHAGGPAVLRMVQANLGLDEKPLKASYDTLKNYGNMQGSTVFFAMDKIMKQENENAQNFLLVGFSPGLAGTAVLLKKVGSSSPGPS